MKLLNDSWRWDNFANSCFEIEIIYLKWIVCSKKSLSDHSINEILVTLILNNSFLKETNYATQIVKREQAKCECNWRSLANKIKHSVFCVGCKKPIIKVVK